MTPAGFEGAWAFVMVRKRRSSFTARATPDSGNVSDPAEPKAVRRRIQSTGSEWRGSKQTPDREDLAAAFAVRGADEEIVQLFLTAHASRLPGASIASLALDDRVLQAEIAVVIELLYVHGLIDACSMVQEQDVLPNGDFRIGQLEAKRMLETYDRYRDLVAHPRLTLAHAIAIYLNLHHPRNPEHTLQSWR